MPITLITGANKGIGYETARRLIERGHTVYATARDIERGERAAQQLGARFIRLDVTDQASIEAAAEQIRRREGHLDVLVNNAGVFGGQIGLDGLSGDAMRREFDANVFGVVRVTQAMLPLLRESEAPVVVNVSSGLGSFATVTDPDSHEWKYPTIVYSASKAAVAMVTVQYAKAVPEVRFNVADPGFTATDLNGNTGHQTVTEGSEAIVRLATIGATGPTGTLQDADGVVPW